MNAEDYIRVLQLKPHPEGGYYKETYRSAGIIPAQALSKDIGADRHYATVIYFLLNKGNVSAFHRIKSDECWHFYEGGPLLIHVVNLNGSYTCVKLGKNIEQGETFQFVVPAGAWFASEPAPDTHYALVGCTVAPGFDFADFEMADRYTLSKLYPQHRSLIHRLTH